MTSSFLKRNYHYHPFELAFSGFSGSGKTTLMEKIISLLSQHYKVGYVKHDAHQFLIDKEGKDTDRAKKAGANSVLIRDQFKYAFISDGLEGGMGPYDLRQDLFNCHFTLVEGHKNTKIKKIIVVDSNQEIIPLIQSYEVTDVLALVIPEGMKLKTDLPYPLFQRDEVQKISDYVLSYLLKKSQEAPCFGLVLNGGKSSRMGQDKGRIQYHGIEQSHYLFNLMGEFCSQTFISCREDQKNLDYLSSVPIIVDRFKEMGPMAGIMSAMMEYPLSSWMVFACDLPLVDRDHIKELIDHTHPFALVSCHHDQKGLPEPLSAIYRPEMLSRFFYFLGQGVDCPRKVLLNSLIHKVQGQFPFKLGNANTAADYLKYSKEINHEN